MLTNPQPPRIHLPKGWQDCVQSAVLHAIALAHYAIVYARAWATDSINARVQLAAENDRLHEACALLREELRIKDIRITQIAPQRRPHYGPHERMAILELRAARGWSLKQTADTFLVTPATIAAWVKRIDENGPEALLQLREPVNKFPDFVRYIGQRLKTLSPTMGKVKIAELNGKTPNEVYHDVLPACERPRVEPRGRWPRSAPCASPHAPVAGHCGAPIRLDVRYHWGRKHLLIIELRRAA